MSTVYLSCICKSGIMSAVVFKNGACISKKISEVKKTTDSKNQYLDTIDVYTTGFKLLRNVVERDSDISHVIIECNNSAFLSWVMRGNSLDKYIDEFYPMMEILDEVPVTYECIYSKDIKAKLYAKPKYVEKEKLSGVLDFM